MLLQARSEGQSLMGKVAASAKVSSLSLGEGIAQQNPLLLELVTRAGLMPVLSNGEAYTFFAPAESTLAQHQQDSPEQLKAFLEQHIVKGSLTTQDLRDGADLTSLRGSSLRICRKKGDILVSGVRLTQPDQLFSNGVWHQMNGAFQPSKTSF
ncbi:hypothetical protein GCM10011405_21600 [Rufibacter glacialis]|nr:hypothetical protein GCM10011405_21600 [Rufibacter glacialis]